jgi:hypothetical protein
MAFSGFSQNLATSRHRKPPLLVAFNATGSHLGDSVRVLVGKVVRLRAAGNAQQLTPRAFHTACDRLWPKSALSPGFGCQSSRARS